MTEERKRRPKGTGSVYKRGDVWEAAYTIPKAQRAPGASARPITKQGPTEAKALANLMAHLRTLGVALPVIAGSGSTSQTLEERYGSEPTHRITNHDPNAPGHSYTLEAWANEWLRDYTGHVDEETRVRYEGHIRNHILPHLGQLTLDRLSAIVLIEDWWKVIKKKRKVVRGVTTDKPLLNDPGLSAVYKTMRLVLKAAEDKIHVRNRLSARLIHPPHQGRRPETDREIEVMTKRLTDVFYREMNRDDPRWSFFLFALLGLRQGERLALSVDSIDLTPGKERLHISKQVAWKTGTGWVLKNSTKNGDVRTVPLFDEFLEAAVLLVDRHKRLTQSPQWVSNPDPAFASLLLQGDRGEVRHRKIDAKEWKEIIGSDERGHIARHATGQLLAEKGIAPDVAKILLGWRSDAYAHYYRTISIAFAGRALREQYVLDESAAPPPESRPRLGITSSNNSD
jgi:integrase